MWAEAVGRGFASSSAWAVRCCGKMGVEWGGGWTDGPEGLFYSRVLGVGWRGFSYSNWEGGKGQQLVLQAGSHLYPPPLALLNPPSWPKNVKPKPAI
jgi:hypothetical protein